MIQLPRRRAALPAALALLALVLLSAGPAVAGQPGRLCVYDPSGANGDVFNLMKDYQAAAVAWGVDFELKPYTDEKTAAEDFKAGQCEAVLMTGTRCRQFHKFAGTLEAMGGLPEYGQLKSIVRSLSKAGAAKLMTSGDYEVGGIFSGGAVYLFVRDKAINSAEALAGRRLATLDFDVAAKTMVKQVGASMVAADVGTFAGMFNNGSVDACYAPATAYQALELYKGIGSGGGVVRYPLAQMTLQLLFRTGDMPEGFGASSRTYAASRFDAGLKLVKGAEKAISKWIDISKEDKGRYDQMFQAVRIALRDDKRVYHKSALKLMRKVRCKSDPARAECAEALE